MQKQTVVMSSIAVVRWSRSTKLTHIGPS